MKKNPNRTSSTSGFTLVELLVVIVIIAGLAAVVLTMTQRFKKSSLTTKNIMTLRQIGVLATAYSAENSGNLPAMRPETQRSNGSWDKVDWPIGLLAQVYPDLSVNELRDKKWWMTSKPFLYNAVSVGDLKSESSFQIGKSGFGMNDMLMYNVHGYTDAWAEGKGGATTKGVPISKIPNPSRTVLFSTSPDYHFVDSSFGKPDCKRFIIDGKVPMMFVDMHAETVPVKAYTKTNYDWTGY